MTGRILAIGFGIIVLLGGLYAWWTLRVERQMRDDREVVLRSELAQIRRALASYTKDNGHGPESLNDLVPRYLHRIPADPITHAVNWKTDTEEQVEPSNDFGATPAPTSKSYVIDVHSAAPPPYSDY